MFTAFQGLARRRRTAREVKTQRRAMKFQSSSRSPVTGLLGRAIAVARSALGAATLAVGAAPRSVPAVSTLAVALVSVVLSCGRPEPTAVGSTVRVMVYNIHAGKDTAGVRNLADVASLVTASDADVVLLQEVDRGTERSGGEDQPVLLSDLTGHAWAFGRTLDFQGGLYGIAVLSRWPIRADSVIPLVVDPPQERAGGAYEPRGLLVATVETPAGPLEVLNTHLDASLDDGYRWQEIQAVRAIADRSRAGGRWTVVVGDLNSVPDARTPELLRSGGWLDAWEACGAGDGYTYPAGEPVRRIDYLWVGSGVECMAARVEATAISDHRPLLVDLLLGPRATGADGGSASPGDVR